MLSEKQNDKADKPIGCLPKILKKGEMNLNSTYQVGLEVVCAIMHLCSYHDDTKLTVRTNNFSLICNVHLVSTAGTPARKLVPPFVNDFDIPYRLLFIHRAVASIS